MSSDGRNRLVSLGRYALGLALLAWILTTLDWNRTADQVGQIGPSTLAAVVLLGLGNVGIVALMWIPLLEDTTNPRWRDLIKVDLAIKFVNVLLPSRLGGRAAAPIVLQRIAHLDWPDAVAVAGVHTGFYSLCYGLVCTVGVVALAPMVGSGILLLLVLSTMGYLLAGAVIIGGGLRAGAIGRMYERLIALGRRIPVAGEKIATSLQAAGSSLDGSGDVFRSRALNLRAAVGYAAVWAVAAVLVPGVRFWLLLDAFSTGGVALLPIPLYIVTAYSVSILPITPGGIGVTEASSTVVFVALGFPAAAVVPAIFLDRTISIYLPSLLGWFPAVRMELLDSQVSTDGR